MWAPLSRLVLLSQRPTSQLGSCPAVWAGPLLYREVQKAANELRGGDIVEKAGQLLEVVKVNYTQGAGRAHGLVQLDVRDLISGNKRTERLRPSDTLEHVMLMEKACQVLYTEGALIHLMDKETYDTITVDGELFRDKKAFAVEGQDVALQLHGDTPVRGRVPTLVALKVQSSPPSHMGSTGVQPKSVTLDNGCKVTVPGHISEGDTVLIRTEDLTFMKKVTDNSS